MAAAIQSYEISLCNELKKEDLAKANHVSEPAAFMTQFESIKRKYPKKVNMRTFYAAMADPSIRENRMQESKRVAPMEFESTGAVEEKKSAVMREKGRLNDGVYSNGLSLFDEPPTKKQKRQEEAKAVASLLPLIKNRPHEAEATAGAASREQETGEPAIKKTRYS